MSFVSRRVFLVSLAAAMLTLVACAGFSSKDNIVIKSLNDDRQYRYLELSNGLKVMLVSDMQAEKAAASLDVFTGSAQNPNDRPGLAHFVEHMLFLGTKKYPDAGSYQKYINENGGSHNAYTSFEHTNYFFEIPEAAFEPLLDRYSQFFIAPLFDEQYVEREKHAVNAEYKAGIKNEERRQLDVLREVANPKHPFSRFSVGSLETLSSDVRPVRDDVIRFYDIYYVAENMTLSVLAPRSLDELETLVKDKFSDIRSGDVPERGYAVDLFEASNLPAWVTIKPEQERRSISLLFPLPDQLPNYKDQPLNVIGHVLGHEGPNSLYSYLKRENWAESLVAGQGLSYDGVTVFSLSIGLTEKGLEHKSDVLDIVFSAIARAQQEGIPKSVFDELKQVSELEFAYQDKGSESRMVTSISNDLHYYSPAEVLHANYSYQQYRSELIQSLLAQLTIENAIIVDVDSAAITDKYSSYYNTPYSQSSLAAVDLDRWANRKPIAEVQLPPANPFIPEQLLAGLGQASSPAAEQPGESGLEKDEVLPSLILDKPGFAIWYKGVDRFKQPKIESHIYLSSPKARSTVEKQVKLALYTRLLNDQLNEYLYDANMAGLYATIGSYQQGLTIQVYGFSEKQPYLVSNLLKRYREAEFDEAQFHRIKRAYLTSLANAHKQTPYQQLMRVWRSDMQPDSYSLALVEKAAEQVSLKDVEAYAKQFWQQLNAEVLINGDLNKEQALSLSQNLYDQVAVLSKDKEIKPFARKKLEVNRLSKTNYWQQKDIDHNDSAYVLYWQAQDDSLQTTAHWLMLSRVLESGYYHQLRTQEQLGYIVFETYYPLWRVPGIMFVVQSPEVGVEHIHQSTFGFLQNQVSRLGLMGESQLETYKNALIANITQKPKNLASESDYYQRSLAYRRSNDDPDLFTRKDQLVAAIEALDASSWQAFIQQLSKEAYQRMFLVSTNEGAKLENFKRLNGSLSSKGSFEYPKAASKEVAQ